MLVTLEWRDFERVYREEGDMRRAVAAAQICTAGARACSACVRRLARAVLLFSLAQGTVSSRRAD